MENHRVMMDTYAYAAFLRGNLGVKEAVQQADEIVLSPVVLGELLAGFHHRFSHVAWVKGFDH